MTKGVAAVVLCAGGASRWLESANAAGFAVAHKLLAPLRGRTVVELAVGAALAARLDATLVITGSVPMPASVTADSRVTVVHNPDWASGQASSLAVALDTCASLGMVSAVCGLGDQPFLEPEAWELLGRGTFATPIAVATYGGVRRNPVRLDASIWSMIPRDGDQGARPLFRSKPSWVTEVACPGNPTDIDTVEDLLSWS